MILHSETSIPNETLRIDIDMFVTTASPARTALKNNQLIRPTIS